MGITGVGEKPTHMWELVSESYNPRKSVQTVKEKSKSTTHEVKKEEKIENSFGV